MENVDEDAKQIDDYNRFEMNKLKTCDKCCKHY